MMNPRRYLAATGRQDVVDAADHVAAYLTADPEVYADPETISTK
jgi:aconitate hydratase